VHPRHVDVGHHHVDGAVRLELGQGLDAIAGEHKSDGALANLMPEFLLDQKFQVRLVIDHEDLRGHATFPTRKSISLRSVAKSIGLVSSDSAPRSSALRLVSASP